MGTRAATAATGPRAKGQLSPPQVEGTTRGATADPSTGSTGGDPDCIIVSPTRGAKDERAHTAGAEREESRSGEEVRRRRGGGRLTRRREPIEILLTTAFVYILSIRY